MMRIHKMKLGRETKHKLKWNDFMFSFERFIIIMNDKNTIKRMSDFEINTLKREMKKASNKLNKLKSLITNDK